MITGSYLFDKLRIPDGYSPIAPTSPYVPPTLKVRGSNMPVIMLVPILPLVLVVHK